MERVLKKWSVLTTLIYLGNPNLRVRISIVEPIRTIPYWPYNAAIIR